MCCRAISVILGDRWKKMKNEERRMYTLEAKALAEEQKRLNPDCWKRKRTNSVSFVKLGFFFHYADTCVCMVAMVFYVCSGPALLSFLLVGHRRQTAHICFCAS